MGVNSYPLTPNEIYYLAYLDATSLTAAICCSSRFIALHAIFNAVSSWDTAAFASVIIFFALTISGLNGETYTMLDISASLYIIKYSISQASLVSNLKIKILYYVNNIQLKKNHFHIPTRDLSLVGMHYFIS